MAKSKFYDSDKFIEQMKEKWKDVACPMCQSQNWSISATIFLLPQYKDKKVILDDKIFPVIPVSCQNCGNTVLVSAIISGMIEKFKKEKIDE